MTKTMSDETFAELMQSVKEGAKILRGELPPASEFVHTRTDVKAIREKVGLSQQEFANLLCISKRTLEGWEQGQRKLTGPVRALLTIFQNAPEYAMNALHGYRY
jgi:putative transcriptional regulator